MLPDQLPNSLIRGVSEKKKLTSDGRYAAATLFYPDERTANERDDGGFEVSVNWEDDDSVVRFTLNYRENENIKFAHGVVRLSCDVIERINISPQSVDGLTRERDRLDNNPYHGNIVFRNDLPKNVMRSISGALALFASSVITRP